MVYMISDIPTLVGRKYSKSLDALGSDGFSICFYRKCWHLIKKDLVSLITWTHSKGEIGGATKSTFLSLIPKDPNPSSIKHFRPISLCNSSYKFVSKILSLWLKSLIPDLISPNQGRFISRQQINDNILSVQEAIPFSKKI